RSAGRSSLETQKSGRFGLNLCGPLLFDSVDRNLCGERPSGPVAAWLLAGLCWRETGELLPGLDVVLLLFLWSGQGDKKSLMSFAFRVLGFVFAETKPPYRRLALPNDCRVRALLLQSAGVLPWT
ncbi:MAG: hypothetical protein WAU86_14900, partial [Oricola sp.]